MLSRVADSIFWMNRYIERAENVARFIEVNLHLTLGHTNGYANQWDPLVITTGDHEAFKGRYGVATQKNVIDFLTFDKDNPNSIVSCLRSAGKRPQHPRDHLLGDVAGAKQVLSHGCAARRTPGV